MLMVLLFC